MDGISKLRARLDAKGWITVPKALRMQLGLMASSQILLRVAGEELHGIAAPALLRQGLSLGDAACLGTAAVLGLPVLTADRLWAELDTGVAVRLLR